ncbi:MAG: HAMP domain-containing sensor histidine kinase [Nitriliruptoraceae bacterium]
MSNAVDDAVAVTVHRVVIVGLVASVVVTAGLRQPAGTHRTAAIAVSAAAVAIAFTLGRPQIWPLWRATGGVVASALIAVLFAVTGGTESIYQDALVAIMVISAVTLPGRLVAVNVVAAVLAAASTWIYDPRFDGVFLADLVADLAVWLAVTLGVYLQTRAVRHRTDELRRSNEHRRAMLNAVSHELRTPLTSVVGFAETLDRLDETLDAAQRREVVGQLRASASHLATLVDVVLEAETLLRGQGTSMRRPTDVAAVVAGVLATYDRAGPRVDRAIGAVVADVDAAMLARIVDNLVANAVRAAGADGRIRVTVRSQAADLVVSVDDDGPGIAPGFHEAMFEPFIQGPERWQDPRPGLGLGLTLVRSWVALHGGEVSAVDVAPHGTRIDVVLPDCVIDRTASDAVAEASPDADDRSP